MGFVPAVDDSTPTAPVGCAADVVDVFVYVVVLNLFIEYFPAVISESFTLSLLTAVLLLIVALLVSRLAVRRLLAPAPRGFSAAGGQSPGR